MDFMGMLFGPELLLFLKVFIRRDTSWGDVWNLQIIWKVLFGWRDIVFRSWPIDVKTLKCSEITCESVRVFLSIALFRIYNMNSLPYSFIKVSQFFLKNFQPVWFFVYFLIWHSCMFLALIISLQSQSLTFIDFLCLFWSMVFIFLFHFFFPYLVRRGMFI